MSGTRVGLTAILCGALSFAAVSAAQEQNKDKDKDKGGVSVTIQGKDTDAGLVIKSDATAKEVGLPLYPGSKPHKDNQEDSSGANVGLWGTTFGFKVVALKMESNDAQDKVASYYQKALAKYGKVLDCSNNPAGTSEKDKSSNELTCQDDRPDAGGKLFKAGSKRKQHIVGVTPNGTGSVYHLVYLETRDDEKSTQ